ncbi:MAG: hypothetical protein ACYC2U_04580 [Candidatus Amoebophilus sp.]
MMVTLIHLAAFKGHLEVVKLLNKD